MPGPPEISVVVATHNRPTRLARLLRSLEAQTLELERFEVVVVNDGSSGAETRQLLDDVERESALALRAIHRPRSGGRARARNDGWRAAGAPYVAFTDDDCTVDPLWLESGLRMLREHPDAIVQGPTFPEPGEHENYGPFTHTLTIDRLGPYYETCNIFYPRALLADLGGFDEEFAIHGGEDTDLAWRAIRQSHEAVFAPEARAFHAVEWRGPLGMLRHAAHWHQTVLVFARYPEIRDSHAFHRRIFWKWTHYALVRFLLSLLLPNRLLLVKHWLARPYYLYLWTDNSRRAGPWLAPYVILLDLAELTAMLRGSLRYRTLVL